VWPFVKEHKLFAHAQNHVSLERDGQPVRSFSIDMSRKVGAAVPLFRGAGSPSNTFAVSIQQYADDTQLYVSQTPTDMHAQQSLLSDCLSALHSWFCHNGLALNSTKSESILIGTSQRLSTFPPIVSPTIDGTPVPFQKPSKRLESHWTKTSFSLHPRSATSASTWTPKPPWGRTSPEPSPTASLLYAGHGASADLWRGRFCSRSSYHSSCLGLTTAMRRSPDNQLRRRLQSVLNAAGFLREKVRGRQSAVERPTLSASAAADRVQAGGAHVGLPLLPAFDSSTISCWWTPQSGGHRLAAVSEISVYVDTRRIPPMRHSTIGDRAFPVAAWRVWNSLPPSVASSESLTVFRRRLKSELVLPCFGPDCVWRFCLTPKASLVHGQVTIIFVCLSVCLSVCLCRVFLSRLWSDFDQTRTHVIRLGLVVSPII